MRCEGVVEGEVGWGWGDYFERAVCRATSRSNFGASSNCTPVKVLKVAACTSLFLPSQLSSKDAVCVVLLCIIPWMLGSWIHFLMPQTSESVTL